MKMIKTFNSILACGLLLMSIGLAFGQTAGEKKLKLVVQTGHSRTITTVAFSPNGKLMASGDSDENGSEIKIWDLETETEIKTISCHFAVESLTFSPDSNLIAFVCSKRAFNGKWAERSIKIWDITAQQELDSITIGYNGNVFLNFLPDGKKVLINGEIWDITTGKQETILQKLENNNSQPSSFKFLSLCSQIGEASGSIVKFWDYKSGKLIKTVEINNSIGVEFSPDCTKFANINENNEIEVWNVSTGKIIKTLDRNITLDWVLFSPNGEYIVANFCDYVEGKDSICGIQVWDAANGELFKKISTNFSDEKVIFSVDGKQVATFSFGNIEILSFPEGKTIKSLKSHSNPVDSVVVSPNNNQILSSNFNQIRLWNLQDENEFITSQNQDKWIKYIAYSPDGKKIATTGVDKTVKIWDVKLNNEITIQSEYSRFKSIAFSSNGEQIVGVNNHKIIIWDVKTGNEIRTLNWTLSSGIFSNVKFSPNSNIIAAAYGDTILVWNSKTGEVTKIMGNPTENIPSSVYSQRETISSLVFSLGGKQIFSSGLKGSIKLWNVETGKEIKEFQSKSVQVNSIALSPNGQILASASKDTNIKLWNVNTGNEIKTLQGHSGSVLSVAFSPDGKFLVSGGGDAKTKIWNVETGKEIVSLVALDENDWAVVTPDGRFDASEGALKLMHYAYGLEIINLEQLKEAYYEPGLLQKLLGYSTEPLRPIVPLKDVKLYPEIVSQTVTPDSTKLQIKLKNRGGGIGRVQVFVGNELGNKLVVEDARDARLRQNPDVAEAVLEVDLRGTNYLKGRANKITVVTSNYLREIGKGNIQSRGSEIVWLGAGKEEEYKLPTLYAIIGGVSDYEGERLDLRFAAKDAEDFANALSLGAKKLFCDKSNPNCLDKVQIRTLSTAREKPEEQPTKENFRRAFADVAARAKPEDIVVVYLAGHGVSFGGGTDSYFYLTKEARTASADELSKVLQTSTISSEELTDWLTFSKDNRDDIFIKAMKQVVILDTCASGNAAGQLALTAKRDLSGDQIRAVEFLKDKTGTFVLMASTADAPSYEASEFGQGLLTYSLLQAMKGAELDKGEFIDVRRLFSYAEKEVPKMATNIGGVQKPIVSAPRGNNFVIGQMTDAEKKQINLPTPKPLMLRPLLTSPPINNDPLKLIPELRKRFDAESSYEVVRQRGEKEPRIIYIDDDNFPGAIRVTGTYTVEGGTVRVKAFVVKDEKVLVELPEISAAKDKVLDELMAAFRVALANGRFM